MHNTHFPPLKKTKPWKDSFSHLQIVNQQSSEVAATSKQHIAMGLENTALDKDAAVTEEVSLSLLIELKQQFGQVAGHLHVWTSVTPARERKDNGVSL